MVEGDAVIERSLLQVDVAAHLLDDLAQLLFLLLLVEDHGQIVRFPLALLKKFVSLRLKSLPPFDETHRVTLVNDLRDPEHL